MKKYIRTPKGRLIGVFDKQKKYLQIKNGKKLTTISVPDEGLAVQLQIGESTPENVYISTQT